MTELDHLVQAHVRKHLENEPLSEEEVCRIIQSYRSGFFTCRKLAIEELKYLGPYAQANNLQLGEFIGRRYLAIAALGEMLAEDTHS